MLRLHEGLDYKLYKIYVFGGLAAYVVYVALLLYISEFLGWIEVADSQLLAVYAAPITPWILGILAYWWWVLLFKGNRELLESVRNRPSSAPEIGALKSWSTLYNAMSIYGGNVDEMLAAEKAARLPVLIFYGMQNLFVLWVFGGFWAYVFFQSDFPLDFRKVTAVGAVVIAVVFMLMIPFLLGRSLKAGEAAYLAPLGLAVSQPGSDLSDDAYLLGLRSIGEALVNQGATVLGGRRLERQVRIATVGKRSLTWVEAGTPPFEIDSQAGKLVASQNVPPFVAQALKGLRKAKRWQGIRVIGSSQGIAVERESPGENMWLYDLWLVERLLEASKETG